MNDRAAATRLLEALRDVGQALDARDYPWALVGGLAVSVRVEPRFTRDIDLVVAVPDDSAAEQLVAHLAAAGFALRLSLEQQALNRLAAVRLVPRGEPEQGVVVDLLFCSSTCNGGSRNARECEPEFVLARRAPDNCALSASTALTSAIDRIEQADAAYVHAVGIFRVQPSGQRGAEIGVEAPPLLTHS